MAMEQKLGKVIIAPAVLTTIVRLTALSQPGVRRMAPFPPALERMLDRSHTEEGVRIQIEGDEVSVDLYIVVDAGINMRELGETLQREITRAIHDMVGMSVREVNVHIDGVEFPAGAPSPSEPQAPSSHGEGA
ncbi:MAG: Asp23/Gls24 family envelope stress response protein [Anaerolineae bacterium]